MNNIYGLLFFFKIAISFVGLCYLIGFIYQLLSDGKDKVVTLEIAVILLGVGLGVPYFTDYYGPDVISTNHGYGLPNLTPGSKRYYYVPDKKIIFVRDDWQKPHHYKVDWLFYRKIYRIYSEGNLPVIDHTPGIDKADGENDSIVIRPNNGKTAVFFVYSPPIIVRPTKCFPPGYYWMWDPAGDIKSGHLVKVIRPSP